MNRAFRAAWLGMALLMGCTFIGKQPARRGARRWATGVPPVRGTSGLESIEQPGGSKVLFMRHSGPFDRAFAILVQDLESGGWTIRDSRGGTYYRAISGCGESCETQRFYAVTRRQGPTSTTLLRVTSTRELGAKPTFSTSCEPVGIALPTLDEAARYGPVYDVDLDRDGRLDVYVPRAEGDDIVWDAVVMSASCGHRVGTFVRLPADPHMNLLGPGGLVDLTVSEPRVDDDGRTRRVPVTYRYDGTSYVPLSDATSPS